MTIKALELALGGEYPTFRLESHRGSIRLPSNDGAPQPHAVRSRPGDVEGPFDGRQCAAPCSSFPKRPSNCCSRRRSSAGHARAILSIPYEGRATEAHPQAGGGKAVRFEGSRGNRALCLLGKKSAMTPRPRSASRRRRSFKTVAKALRDVLHTPVRVEAVLAARTRLRLSSKDEEELERLFEELIAAAS